MILFVDMVLHEVTQSTDLWQICLTGHLLVCCQFLLLQAIYNLLTFYVKSNVIIGAKWKLRIEFVCKCICGTQMDDQLRLWKASSGGRRREKI